MWIDIQLLNLTKPQSQCQTQMWIRKSHRHCVLFWHWDSHLQLSRKSQWGQRWLHYRQRASWVKTLTRLAPQWKEVSIPKCNFNTKQSFHYRWALLYFLRTLWFRNNTTYHYPSGYCVTVENDVNLRCSSKGEKVRNEEVILGNDCWILCSNGTNICELCSDLVWD